MSNFHQQIPTYVDNLLRSEGALRATFVANNAAQAAATAGGGGQQAATAPQTAPTSPQEPKPGDTQPEKTPPVGDATAKDQSWIWKLAIPVGLMVVGPIVGLFLGTIGFLFDVAVPLVSYGFGCVLCGIFFAPGVIWIRIVKWLDERSAKRQNLKKPRPKSV